MRTYENLREAIGLMTAWADDTDSQALQLGYLATIEDPSELLAMIEGLTSLAGILLTKRHKEMGVSEAESLRQIASEHADR